MNKSFSDKQTDIETPKDIGFAKKPLNKDNNSNRVDINILKSKLRASEAKEFKKNTIMISFLILILGILGVYLSF